MDRKACALEPMPQSIRQSRPDERGGFAYVAVLFLLVVVFTMGMGFILRVNAETTATMARGSAMQANYLAESAANHATWLLLNDPSFPADETKYYMHDLANGRYGFKVRRHTDTTFATIATIGVIDETIVKQGYVLRVLPPQVDTLNCVTNGLIGHYTLDDGSGLVATETSGSGPDATLQKDPAGTGWTTGQLDGAYEFSDNNAYFRTPTNSTDLQITNDYSIAVWIKADPSEKSWAGIVSKNNDSGSQNHWTLQFNNASGTSKAITIYHPGGNWTTTYTLAEAMGAWHHIAFTYQSSPALASLYVDGILHSQSTSFTSAPGSGDGKLHIGAERTAASSYTFTGLIDDARIYDRVLAPDEVDTIYQNNCAGTPKLYWTDRGDDVIRRSDIDGANVEDIIISGLGDPQSIDIDPDGGKIYWTDQTGNRIRRADLDGSNIQNIITSGINGPEGLMLDRTAQKIYWNEQPGATLRRANYDGSNIETLRTDLSGWVVQLSLDLVNNKVYWTENGNRIRRCNLDGSNAELVLTVNYAYGIDLDVAGGKMYWAEANLNEIRRANVDGSNVESIITTGLGDPRAIYVDPDDSKVYWTDIGTDVIQRADFDGSNVETLITGLSDSRGLTLDSIQISAPTPSTGKIYWSDRGDDVISRADNNGSNVEDIVASGVNDPYGIGIDESGGKVYWADRRNNTIERANLDGSNAETVVSGLNNPEALAVDTEAGKIYWGDDGDDKISRSDLDGANVEDVVTGISAGPDFMTLDLVNDKIYWTETGSSGRIVWADMDGSNEQTLVTSIDAGGIAVYPANNKLYWVNDGANEIWSADLDGGNAAAMITGLANPQAIAIDFDEDKIYWTNSTDDTVERADLDGSNVEVVVTGRNDARGLAVGDLASDGTPFTPPVGGGSVVFESFAESNASSDTDNIDLPTPRGTSAGDLLIAALAVDRNETLSAPRGWTAIEVNGDGQVTFGVWYKIARASEPSTHNFTWGSGEEAYGWIMRFTGHDATTPINASATDRGASSTPNSPSVTTTIANAMILRLGGFDDDDITVDNPGLSGHTAITMDKSGTGNGSASGGAGYLEQVTAGASRTSSFSLSGNQQYRTVTIAIAPN